MTEQKNFLSVTLLLTAILFTQSAQALVRGPIGSVCAVNCLSAPGTVTNGQPFSVNVYGFSTLASQAQISLTGPGIGENLYVGSNVFASDTMFWMGSDPQYGGWSYDAPAIPITNGNGTFSNLVIDTDKPGTFTLAVNVGGTTVSQTINVVNPGGVTVNWPKTTGGWPIAGCKIPGLQTASLAFEAGVMVLDLPGYNGPGACGNGWCSIPDQLFVCVGTPGVLGGVGVINYIDPFGAPNPSFCNGIYTTSPSAGNYTIHFPAYYSTSTGTCNFRD